ncbi:MAG: L,D-transpeptidase family protein [Verrucomicrobiales bacterium]
MGTVYLPGVRPENSNVLGHGSEATGTSGVMKQDTVSYWEGDGIAGAPSITISISQQRAYFYKAGHLVGVSLVSTGSKGHETPPGNYKIIQKNRDHRSTLYGDFVYPDGSIAKKDVRHHRRQAARDHFRGGPDAKLHEIPQRHRDARGLSPRVQCLAWLRSDARKNV